MIFKVHHWREDEYVKVEFLLGGEPGIGRLSGEPTHTRTFASAGILTLYPEAWDDLREVLEEGLRGLGTGGTEIEFEEGKPD